MFDVGENLTTPFLASWPAEKGSGDGTSEGMDSTERGVREVMERVISKSSFKAGETSISGVVENLTARFLVEWPEKGGFGHGSFGGIDSSKIEKSDNVICATQLVYPASSPVHFVEARQKKHTSLTSERF